jgi:hypothetical protein
MANNAIPKRPWIVSGSISFAFMEFASLWNAIMMGRLEWSSQVIVAGIMLTAFMAALGLLVGFLFAKTRKIWGPLPLYAQGVAALVVVGLVSGVLTKGPSWVGTGDFASGMVIAVAIGLLFVFLAKKLGAQS